MKILLAEDDTRLGQLISHMLKKQQYIVDWVKTGRAALDYAYEGHYDIIILDWLMPDIDGIQVCTQLRQHQCHTAILMLTAKTMIQDRIEGLDAGADDYLTKPFEFGELFARIRSLSRRSMKPMTETTISLPPYRLHQQERVLYYNDVLIELTTKEYQLIELFMSHPGQLLTREQIMKKVWDFDRDVTNNALDALMKLLRKKLIDDERFQIRSVRGVGYRLEVTHV